MQLNVSKMNGWSSCSSFSVNARTWNWYETLLRAHKEHHDLICINQNVYVKSMYIHVSNLALYRSEYSTWFIALNSLILYVCIICVWVCVYIWLLYSFQSSSNLLPLLLHWKWFRYYRIDYSSYIEIGFGFICHFQTGFLTPFFDLSLHLSIYASI